MDKKLSEIEYSGDYNTDLVKQKMVFGILTLTGRTFFLQAISLVAVFFLTVFLSPSDYGIFFLVSAIVNFFSYFSDIGLAAALVQKKELTSKYFETTFTVQNILVLLLVIIIFAVTPWIRNWYQLEDVSVYLLWALAVALLLSSLKTIPSVILERRLDFNKLVIPQILESIIFNLVAVILAWKGYGIMSLTYAVLARGVVGLVSMYVIAPWKVRLAIDSEALRSLLKFGLPYQLNTFLAVIKDDGLIVFLGTILGASGIGYLGWAQKWGSAPLRFFMDQVIKVTFPAFSRIQDNKEELSRAVSKSVFFVALLVFPSIIGLVILAPILTEIIPKYEKWRPALLALTLIGVNSMWAGVTTPLTNALNAIGKISVTFWLMVMWTVLSWGLVPILSLKYGIDGAALGYALVGCSSGVAILVVRKYIAVDILNSILKPLLVSVVMGIILILIKNLLPVSFISVVILITFGIIIYAGLLRLIIGPEVVVDFKKIVASFKKGDK